MELLLLCILASGLPEETPAVISPLVILANELAFLRSPTPNKRSIRLSGADALWKQSAAGQANCSHARRPTEKVAAVAALWIFVIFSNLRRKIGAQSKAFSVGYASH